MLSTRFLTYIGANDELLLKHQRRQRPPCSLPSSSFSSISTRVSPHAGTPIHMVEKVAWVPNPPPPHPPPKLRPTIWPSCHLFHPNEENTSRWRRRAWPNATMTMIEGAYRPEDLGTLDWRRGRSMTAVAVGSVVVVVHTSISFYMWCWFGFLSCWSVHIYLWVCTSMCIDLWNIDVYLDLMIWTFGIDLGMRLCIDLNELARINLFLCSSSTS